MILLDEPIGDEVGFASFAELEDADFTNGTKTFCLIGYPADKLDKTQWASPLSVSAVRPNALEYRASTFPGMAGSPLLALLDDGSLQLCGIHSTVGSDGVRQGPRINSAMFENMKKWKAMSWPENIGTATPITQ